MSEALLDLLQFLHVALAAFLGGYLVGKLPRQDGQEQERRMAPLEDSPRPPTRLETSDLGIGWEPLEGEGSAGRARYL